MKKKQLLIFESVTLLINNTCSLHFRSFVCSSSLSAMLTISRFCRKRHGDVTIFKKPASRKFRLNSRKMKRHFSGRYSGNFSGATELLKRLPWFPNENVPNENSSSTFSKLPLILGAFVARFVVTFTSTLITQDDVVSQRHKFGSAFLSYFSWQSKIALSF